MAAGVCVCVHTLNARTKRTHYTHAPPHNCHSFMAAGVCVYVHYMHAPNARTKRMHLTHLRTTATASWPRVCARTHARTHYTHQTFHYTHAQYARTHTHTHARSHAHTHARTPHHPHNHRDAHRSWRSHARITRTHARANALPALNARTTRTKRTHYPHAGFMELEDAAPPSHLRMH